jgi:NADPH:quinone reductase-like Zn-dependent oxidoreductase
MKAVRVNAWGQPTVLEDIPQPTPAENEVLVRVMAASLNPFDTFVHAGYMQSFMNLPLTLGTDFSGEVVDVGSGIRHVKPGDAVYGLVPMHPGAFAEYVIAKDNEVTHKPKTLDFVQAAGAPLANMAAHQALFDLGKAKKGEKILVIGAAGAVGASTVQMAKDLGATVYAVDVPERAAFTLDLGADYYVDCNGERYEEATDAVDLVLDYVGGENMTRSCKLLLTGGRYVTSLMMPAEPEEVKTRGILAFGLGTQPRVEDLDDLAQRIDSGRLKVFINTTFPLDQANEAFAYRMQTTKPGKVVLTVS